MIKFNWKDNEDIGHYECTMYDDSAKLETIFFWDYSNEYNRQEDLRNI